MPNKTIYVSKEDTSIFEEAKQIAGEALSSVIAKAVREFVANTKIQRKGMKEVSLLVGPNNNERTKKFIASFVGEWKGFSDDKEWFQRADIYRTQKGNWVVYLVTVCKASLLTDKDKWKTNGDYLVDSKRSDLYVGGSLEEFKNKLPKKLYSTLEELFEKEKNPVEFLDI